MLGFQGNQPIQRGLPSNDAIYEFLAQSPVRWGEARPFQGGFQQVFDEFAALPALQNLDRNFSWILAAHNL